MGCSSSKGPVPTEEQIKKANGLMDWIDATQMFDQNDDQRIVKAEMGKALTGGNSCLAKTCTFTRKDGSQTTAMLKMSGNGTFETEDNRKLCRHREAVFFNYLKEQDVKFQHCQFPEVYLASADPKTGRAIIMMEFIEGGKNLMECFGQHKYKMRPNLERPINLGGEIVTALDCTRQVTKSLADMHAKFWMNKEFLAANKAWILRSDWYEGENLDFMKYLNDQLQSIHFVPKNRLVPSTVTIQTDQQILDIVAACFKKSTPDGVKSFIANRPNYQWTMVHGDMHPGNFVWHNSKKTPVMIDVEVFGQGCGPQDLASFVFFRSSPEWRRKHEKEIVELYHQTLIECCQNYGTSATLETYPLEQCWRDYAEFGAMRMVWYYAFLPLLVKHHVVVDLENSMKAFFSDHNVTPENICPYIV